MANSTLSRLSGWLAHLGVSPLAFDDTLSLVSPLLTVHQLHARVVGKRQETPAASTLVLQAGPGFEGLQAGQFILFGVTINGVRHRRAYSPRSIGGQRGRFAITVQRQAGGVVSSYLNDQCRIGDVVCIEPAGGTFTLPSPLPPAVLMVAGGSGITPCMAMLEHLFRAAPGTRATLIYFARNRKNRIFADALDELARRWPQLRYVAIDSDVHTAQSPDADAGRLPPELTQALLAEHMADWARVPAFCCGPAPLMSAARQLWRDAGADKHLHLEAFVPLAPCSPTADGDATHYSVRLERDHQLHQFEALGKQTLLVAGETAGLTLKHGCRQGLCHECTCRLHSGSVLDLNTGSHIDAQGQPIRLCISAPMSDLVLESLT